MAGIWFGMAWASLALVTLLTALVDAVSLTDQQAPVPAWRFYALELTSAVFFMLVIGPVWRLSRRLRPPALRWPAAIGAHLALSLPFTLVHALWLALSRAMLFGLAGSSYGFPWTASHLLFEWRKDALTLVVMAALGWLLDRLAQSAPMSPSPPSGWRLAVKDGSRTLLLAPDEISHVSSAGNYVELATVHGPVLHRATMAALAEELAPHGFVRIHRAHLVRLAAVTSVASEGSGDFAVTLASGQTLPGSRRYRVALVQLG
jgi:hypothetical protein